MTIRRHQHSIRFSNDEWNAITEAANRNDMTPGEFVRETASRAAADRLDVKEARLSPELIELLKRTFRGVHILTYLKRRETSDDGAEDTFRQAAASDLSAQEKELRTSDDRRRTHIHRPDPLPAIRCGRQA